jgi:hypothetical protein
MPVNPNNPFQQQMSGLFGQIQSGDISWQDFYSNLQQSRYAEFADMNSPMYKTFSNYLKKQLDTTVPRMGVDQSLATLSAGGAGSAGAQNIAAERMKSFNTQRNDLINQTYGKTFGEYLMKGQDVANDLLKFMSDFFTKNNLTAAQLSADWQGGS